MNWTPPAASLGWTEALVRAGWNISAPRPYGPMGLMVDLSVRDGDIGSVIVTQADHEDDDGREWLHASMALQHRDPRYVELAALHAAVFGRKRWSYQVFAPVADHVNIHSHALHLWGRVDGTPALPDMTRGLGSV